jgi:hypothetical protein
VEFEGNGLRVLLEADTETLWVDFQVDEGPIHTRRVPMGAPVEWVLYEGSMGGRHRVTLTKRAETWLGLLRIHGFSLEKGHFLTPVPTEGPKLLFIGDSITAGDCAGVGADDGLEGLAAHCARMSYGMRIARALGAQVHLVAYGGRGLIRDWTGDASACRAADFYERCLADDPESRWDHQTYVPDVVSICLGTNDFSSGIPDQSEWVGAYVQLVRKVLTDAPGARVFLLESPMLGGSGESALKGSVLSFYLDQVLAALQDARVGKLEVPHYPGRPENAHPVASEHALLAEELLPAFARAVEVAFTASDE